MISQKPSVGRIVHYQSYGSPGGEYESEPRAAIITAVNAGLSVDLCVLDPSPQGMYFKRDVPYGPDLAPGSWNWPPRV